MAAGAAARDLLYRRGYPTYTTLKRVMAAIDIVSKRAQPVTQAASTRKPVSDTAGHLPGGYVRNASHYARDEIISPTRGGLERRTSRARSEPSPATS